MLQIKTNTIIAFFLIILASIWFVFPAVFSPYLWASFDSPFHITMIAQFHRALSFGQFPVIWTDGVANYGLPFGIIAHPFTSYGGAALTFTTKNPLISYKLLWLFFSIAGAVGIYKLLRDYASPLPALTGSLLYIFSAYRILNLYIRGALPEFAASVLLIFIFRELLHVKNKSSINTIFLFSLLFTLEFFIHPMFILFSGILTLITLSVMRAPLRIFWWIGLSSVIALGVSAFYLLPLNLEMKYFYQGLSTNFLAPHSGLQISQLVTEQWHYACADGDTPFLRCNRVQAGFPEFMLFLSLPLLILVTKDKKQKKTETLLFILGSVTLFLSTRYAEPLYSSIKYLGSIQFPYRFLNIWILIPPIVLVFWLNTLKRITFLPYLILASILLIRLPQIYTKNDRLPELTIFYHNTDNIHSVMMNTIWMGEPKTYPLKPERIEILAGHGNIVSNKIVPTLHQTSFTANTPLSIADYTFYFPGWRVWMDGQIIPFEWQNPNHRGYITYTIPAGDHTVMTRFSDTKIRQAGKILSIASLTVLVFISILFFRLKRLST